MKKRILHLVLIPRHSGAEQLVVEIAPVQLRNGYDVHVAALGPSEVPFQPRINASQAIGIQWHIPDQVLTRLQRILFLRRIVRVLKPDVIFAHSFIPARYIRAACIGCLRRPAIVSVLHGENDYAVMSSKISERLLRGMTDAVIAVSPNAKSNYVRDTGTPRRIVTILNGIDLARFHVTDETRLAARSALGLDPDIKLIVQVGRITRVQKRPHLSLRAVIPIIQKRRNVHFWLAGLCDEADYLSEMRRLVVEAGVEDRVSFIGSRDDVPRLLAAADVYLMPSGHEAHSVAILEALKSGIPIVASRISAFDFIKKYAGVLMVDPEDTKTYQDAIDAQVNAPRQSRELSEFTIENTVGHYNQLVEQLSPKGR